MPKNEADELKYLRNVFKRLPGERKDYVLNTAASLLAIQEDNLSSLKVKNSELDKEANLSWE